MKPFLLNGVKIGIIFVCPEDSVRPALPIVCIWGFFFPYIFPTTFTP